MEGRQLLSTAASTVQPGFLSPGGAEVAKAAAVISSGAGPEFQKYTSDLHRVEQSSRVAPAQFANLQNDAAQLVQWIQSSNLVPSAMTQQLAELQDVVDQSFIDASYRSSQWTQVQQQLFNALYDVPITTNLPQQTFTQMQLVAREAHVNAANRRQLVADEQAITAALGPKVDTNLGGAIPRDPLVVYYNGQVSEFIHKR
jgi:hypothetical protein